jgi:hypothetical protein
MPTLEEILRCRHCGFRIRGYPAHYVSRRTVPCPICRGETSISLEDRVRLARLAAAAPADERAPAGRAAGEG